MANGGAWHAYDRTRGVRSPSTQTCVGRRTSHMASYVEAEIRLGPLWSQVDLGPHDNETDAEHVMFEAESRGSVDIRTRKIKTVLIWVCLCTIVFCAKNQQAVWKLDFFIIWSYSVFRSRLLVLLGTVGVLWGRRGSLKWRHLCCSAQLLRHSHWSFSPHTKETKVFFFFRAHIYEQKESAATMS